MIPRWLDILSGPSSSPKQNRESVLFEYVCPDPTICSPFEIELKKGHYELWLWGASGGNASVNLDWTPAPITQGASGKGAFAFGILKLKKKTKAFVYPGAAGLPTKCIGTCPGTFGGGGGIVITEMGKSGNLGGGGSDLRLETNDFEHRVIVAGGGGAASGGSTSPPFSYDCQYPGGDAGSETGFNGNGDTLYNNLYTTGGSQIGAGISSYDPQGNGLFGVGGNTMNQLGFTNGSNYGGSGGGGWFGGGGGPHRVSGAGGSSYVWNSTAVKYHSYALGEEYFLFNGYKRSGKEKMPAPSLNPVTTEIGHLGNGVVLIRRLGPITQCIRPKRFASYFLLSLFNK